MDIINSIIEYILWVTIILIVIVGCLIAVHINMHRKDSYANTASRYNSEHNIIFLNEYNKIGEECFTVYI